MIGNVNYKIEKFNARKLLYLRNKIKKNVLKIFYKIKNLVLYHKILLLWIHEHDCVLFLDLMWVFIYVLIYESYISIIF